MEAKYYLQIFSDPNSETLYFVDEESAYIVADFIERQYNSKHRCGYNDRGYCGCQIENLSKPGDHILEKQYGGYDDYKTCRNDSDWCYSDTGPVYKVETYEVENLDEYLDEINENKNYCSECEKYTLRTYCS